MDLMKNNVTKKRLF